MAVSRELKQEFREQLADSLDNLFIDEAQRKSDMNLNIATFLYQNAAKAEELNLQRLRELNLSLPEEFKTGNLESFFESGGDDTTMGVLGNLYGTAMHNKRLLDDAVFKYDQGKALGEDLLMSGAASIEPSAQPIQDFQFSPSEISTLQERGSIPMDADPYTLAGIKSHNDMDIALRRLQAGMEIEAGQMALNEKKLNYATLKNNSAITMIGENIEAGLKSSGVPIAATKHILGTEGGLDYFNNTVMKEISKNQKLYPNIYNELVASLENYAQVASEGVNPYYGFVELAANAYKTGNALFDLNIKGVNLGLINPQKSSSGALMLNDSERAIMMENFPAYEMLDAKFVEYSNVLVPEVFQDIQILEQANKAMESQANIINMQLGEDNPAFIQKYPDVDKQNEMTDISDDFTPEELDMGTDAFLALKGGITPGIGKFGNTINVIENIWSGTLDGGEHNVAKLLREYKGSFAKINELQKWLDENPQDYTSMESTERTYAQMDEYRETSSELKQLRGKWSDTQVDALHVKDLFPDTRPNQMGQVVVSLEDYLNKIIEHEGEINEPSEILTDLDIQEDLALEEEAIDTSLNLLQLNSQINLGAAILRNVWGFSPEEMTELLAIEGVEEDKLPEFIDIITDIFDPKTTTPREIIDDFKKSPIAQ